MVEENAATDAKEGPTGRALARKMYKILKKKRSKAKQAQKKKEKEQGLGKAVEKKKEQVPNTNKWIRVLRGADCPKATNRPVENVAEIEGLLEKRSAAKAEKNYAVADKISQTLIDMEIYYAEERKQWHTRPLLTAEEKAKRRAKKRAAQDTPSEKKQKQKKLKK